MLVHRRKERNGKTGARDGCSPHSALLSIDHLGKRIAAPGPEMLEQLVDGSLELIGWLLSVSAIGV